MRVSSRCWSYGPERVKTAFDPGSPLSGPDRGPRTMARIGPSCFRGGQLFRGAQWGCIPFLSQSNLGKPKTVSRLSADYARKRAGFPPVCTLEASGTARQLVQPKLIRRNHGDAENLPVELAEPQCTLWISCVFQGRTQRSALCSWSAVSRRLSMVRTVGSFGIAF
ncbi:hypothetical protein CSUI_001582 [Cystoisospora suis]|uniref:Uncharacterized protein n=1 Tax=Cystoisospora suis TaxID=483139 RepID=A0A2C6LB83_9APIC|nr:hypothetical protein CSUI_001582 [Cystoisospora suis]